MADIPVVFDADHGDAYRLMLCPLCKGEYTHIDDVYVAGRAREDGDIRPVHVNSHGNVDDNPAMPLGAGGAGRRHTITLSGWCETCSARFAIAFQQHKGQTHVSLLRQEWVLSEGPGTTVAT